MTTPDDKREGAIQRARARAYVGQCEMREKLKANMRAAIETNIEAAILADQRRRQMADRLCSWLQRQDAPSECLPLVRWILAQGPRAFAGFNEYLLMQAHRAAARATDIIDRDSTRIAKQLAEDLNATAT